MNSTISPQRKRLLTIVPTTFGDCVYIQSNDFKTDLHNSFAQLASAVLYFIQQRRLLGIQSKIEIQSAFQEATTKTWIETIREIPSTRKAFKFTRSSGLGL